MDSGDPGNRRGVDRWIELGSLGLEKSLLVAGVPQKKVSKIMTCLQEAKNGVPVEFSDLKAFLGVEDGICILLATLGRDRWDGSGNSTRAGDEYIEIGESYVRINNVEFTELIIGQREFDAFWVNLASNPKFTGLSIEFHTFKRGGSDAFVQIHTDKKWCSVETFYLCTVDHNDHKHARKTTAGVNEQDLSSVDHAGQKRSFEFFGTPILPESPDFVADFVAATTTLRHLHLDWLMWDRGGSKANGDASTEKLANALRKNTSLESFGVWGPIGSLDEVLGAFIQEEEGSHDHHYRYDSPNRTIKTLKLQTASSSVVGALCSVLRTNKTLTRVELHHCDFLPQEWAGILLSLRGNNTLEELSLYVSIGLHGDDIFDALVGLLQFTNTALKSISLLGTNLEHKQSIIDEELRINQEYRTSLAYEEKIVPTTGRIVLCGFPFAGKTSICKTLQQQGSSMFFMGWKNFLQKRWRFRQLLFGRGVHQELHERTRGLDVTFKGKPPHTTSIWDFGGQQEYYVLHDYLFPNAGNSCFLYVCSARHQPGHQSNRDGYCAVKEEADIRGEFRFWMRFIASNFKHLKAEDGRTHRPSVTFVMTHLDTLDDRQRHRFKALTENIVADFAAEFETYLDISKRAKCIDARFAEPVENLFTESKSELRKILDQSQEYKLCSAVRDALQVERIQHPYRYILDLEQVGEICGRGRLRWQLGNIGRAAAGQNNPSEQDFRAGLNTVLKYLNNVGDIIYVEGLNFIIIQVTWFGREVLGHLIDPFQECRAEAGNGILGCLRKTPEDTCTPRSEHGFVRRSILDSFLKESLRKTSLNKANLSKSLIDLMVHLELCFEELPGNEGTRSSDPRFFFPALLESNDHMHASASTALEWKIKFSSDVSNGVCYVGRRLECSDERTFLTPGFFPRLQVVLVNYFRRKNWLSTDSEHFSVSRNIMRFAHDGMEIIVEYSEIDYFVDVLVKSTKEVQKVLEFIRLHVLKTILDLCSSPKGCQGVDLVEAVVRPVCVKNLLPCNERRDQSVRVSRLKSEGPDYVHTWKKRMHRVSDCDSAADLLHGPPMTRRSGGDPPKITKSSEVPQIYFTIEDVRVISKVGASLNTAKSTPVKLHIFCDGAGTIGPHRIDGQPGRVLHLRENSKSFNLSIPGATVHMLLEGTRIGAGVFNIQIPKTIDNRVKNLYRIESLDIDLNQIKDIRRIKGEPSQEDILETLNACSNSLKESERWKKFLDLQNFSDFERDFQVTRCRSPSTGEVCWLCDECFNEEHSSVI